MKILLVDSDPLHSSRWCKKLQTLDVEVIVADQWNQGHRLLGQQRFSAVIVASTSLPRSAADADEHVRQMRAKVKVLACAVDPYEPSVVQNAYAAGFADCFLPDPSADEVRVKVERWRELEGLDQRLAQAQKLESIGELAAGIAHEINTPIQYVGDNIRFVRSAYEDLADVLEQCQSVTAAIDTGTDVAESAAKLRAAIDTADVEYLQEEVPSAIAQTLEGVERVASIVRAMKEFAHPGDSEMTAINLSNSIENTITVARNEWKYVAEMETDFDVDLPSVPCLPGELNQVLLNMIVNAAHAIGESIGDAPMVKGTIRISTRLAPPHAEIRISDTGGGIAPENIDKIFTPFFTTKSVGKGTGQGLAIAYAVVVEKHGGSISVESAVGEGTTFIIRLPLEIPRKSEPSMPPNRLANASFCGEIVPAE